MSKALPSFCLRLVHNVHQIAIARQGGQSLARPQISQHVTLQEYTLTKNLDVGNRGLTYQRLIFFGKPLATCEIAATIEWLASTINPT